MRVSVDERLARLCGDFSVAKIGEWLERKFPSYDTSKADVISIAENKNDKEYFKGARLLGYVRDFPEGRSGAGNRPLLVAAVEMRKILTERTSRQAQFNFAKRVLQNAVRSGAAGLNGYPSQGLFFFYDQEQFFRISLVGGEMEGRKFKFNEAKRQSFYINPDRPNNIAKSRLSESIETYADLREAFSVETLTKEFYGKLFAWYEWAMTPQTGVTFPNDDSTPEDDDKYKNESVIRLVTRLMFTWFIRQRDMVRAELFTVEGVKALLKGFDPKSMEDDNYYRCILQNLFFATFNCQPEKRKFIQRSFHGRCDGFGVKTLYRYEKEFKNPAAFKELVKKTPFLNCALFDCLDKQQRESEGGKLLLFDGFSDTRKRQAHVPNGLFFHPEKGIVPLFDTYEFTIDENNADDADVALDPELLGKVFENLLGAFNPETRETARKATGSFYTPREIVDYMVEESLKNHVKTRLRSKVEVEEKRLDAWLAELFDKTAAAERRELPFDDEVAAEIRESLYSCRILDPACGSGAFPMGVLHCMVRLFGRLDPANIDLNKRLIMRYKQETNLPPDPLETAAEREERLEALKVQLDEGQHYPDYARKLYLIENCIYGVDIQPIATQISKLRFFISLLCDQLRENWNAESENHGLLSLPNLEAKFVCANTLISLPKTEGELELMSCSKIPKLREKLQENRHRIFAARTFRQKEKLKTRDLGIRDEIREAVRSTLAKPDKELIETEEKVIAKLRKDRIPFETPKMVKLQKAVQADFFAPTQGEIGFEMVDANKPKRDQIDAQIEFAQRKIDSELAKSSAANVTKIDQLAALVAGWDPYDQNASSSFFDPEWMFNIADGFDVVIGNPPYVSNMEDGLKQYLKKNFITSSYLLDLYIAFIEEAEKLLSSVGILCYIMPNAWMKNIAQMPIRKFIIERLRVLRIAPKISNAFDSANVETCVLIAARGGCVGPFDVVSYLNDKFVPSHVTSTELFMENEGLVFDVCMTEDTRAIVRKIRSKSHPVEEYFEIIRGIGPYKVGSAGQTSEIVASKAYHATYAKDKTFVPELRGMHVQTFSYNWDGRHYISYGKWLSEPREPRFFEGVRLIFREILGERLVCTLITETFKMDRSLYIAKPFKANITFCKYVLGVLASRAMMYYFKNSANEFDELFPKIRVAEFRKLPIPLAGKEAQEGVAEKVGEVLVAKKKDPEADTSALESQIDQLVYKLYGLTEEEIAIVEGRDKSDAAKDEATAKPSRRRTTRPSTAADSPREEDDEELE